MDQDSTKGTDKRNWRERLGIGTGAASGVTKELPKIAESYSPGGNAEARPAVPRTPVAPRAPAVSKATVKPAPMAPRPAPKAATQAPAEPEKLAEKLRSQREASARLAEQRVQVAKQRAEAAAALPPEKPNGANGASTRANGTAAPKPKFTFAEDDGQGSAPAQQTFVRPAQAPIPPARPSLGTVPNTPAYTPKAPPPAPAPVLPVPPNPYLAQQNPALRPPVPPQYQQQPMPQQYRPVDPATGYAPMPGVAPLPPQGPFPPQRPPFQQNYAPPPATGPRLNMPQRPPLNPGYMPPHPSQPDYGATPTAPESRLNPSRFGRPPFTPRAQAAPPQPRFEDDEQGEQYFEEAPPPPRAQRRQAADYQQAYRDMDPGFDEEVPRSNGPWVLLGLLLLALAIAAAAVWFYQSSIKPQMTGNQATQQEQVPVVPAPADPAKVAPEQPAEPAQATSKKRIYDRIVGDQEVLGGDIVPSEEAPLAPDVNATQDGAAPPSGDDAMPLPIPPPPGDGNTQGSLETDDPTKTSAELETPAAGASQAAVAAPAPGELIEPTASTVATADAPPPDASESIVDEPQPPASVKKVATAKPKKAEPKKLAEKSLGAKPVVLVPAKKKPNTKPKAQVASLEEPATDLGADGDLYGANAEDVSSIASETPPTDQTAPKKKRTLSDFFSNDNQADEAVEAAGEPAAPVPAKKVVATPPPKPAPQPAPTQVAQAGGFVAQLASFRSRDEANSEFSRLKAKHSGVFRGNTAIITQAEVAGTTRYRLNVGGMASRDEATAFCNKLFAAGERDCLVRRQ